MRRATSCAGASVSGAERVPRLEEPRAVGRPRERRRGAWPQSAAAVAWAAAVALVALAGLTDCAEEDPAPVEPPPPPMSHGGPNEEAGQMCVVCHTCGDDATLEMPAPIIDRTHDVCNSCHAPDGTVIVHGEETCEWQMDCDTIPPIVNCDECHSVEYVNDLCEACH